MTMDLDGVGLYARVFKTNASETMHRLSSASRGRTPWLTKADVETGRKFAVLATKAEARDPEAVELLSGIRRFLGLTLFDVLFYTFVYDVPIERMERVRGWPQRSAKILLRSALELVARHDLLGEG